MVSISQIKIFTKINAKKEIDEINKTFRHWKFTYFNYTDEDVLYLTSDELTDRRYIKFGFEICKTGKPHLQGWVWFNKPCRRQGAYKRIFRTKLLKTESGNYLKGVVGKEENICSDMDTYVSKDGKTLEAGERNHRGKESSLAQACEDLKLHNIDKCIEQNPTQFAQHYGNLIKIKSHYDKDNAFNRMKQDAVESFIIWGEPGAGKTRLVYEKHGTDVFSLNKSNGDSTWFDGYSGEKVLLIDEFYGWIEFALLLKITDPMGYPLRLEVKGANCWALWNKVYIISNKPPSKWYPRIDKSHFAAFERRIKDTIYKGSINYQLKHAETTTYNSLDNSDLDPPETYIKPILKHNYHQV